MQIDFQKYHSYKLMDSDWYNSIGTDTDRLNHLRAEYYYNNINELYNTLYYPMNIDIVMCPKNASTVVTKLAGIVNSSILRIYPGRLEPTHRSSIINDYKNKHPEKKYNFFHCREDSYKIAIKRDPIKRAISSAAHITKFYYNHYNKNTEKFNLKVLDILGYCDQVTDVHFISQTKFMGNAKYYDKVYDVNNMNIFFDDMINFYGREKEINKLRNADSEILNINSFYSLKPEDLPSDIIKRLKKIYEVDYDNGWY
jgi:hypothetical protein